MKWVVGLLNPPALILYYTYLSKYFQYPIQKHFNATSTLLCHYHTIFNWIFQLLFAIVYEYKYKYASHLDWFNWCSLNLYPFCQTYNENNFNTICLYYSSRAALVSTALYIYYIHIYSCIPSRITPFIHSRFRSAISYVARESRRWRPSRHSVVGRPDKFVVVMWRTKETRYGERIHVQLNMGFVDHKKWTEKAKKGLLWDILPMWIRVRHADHFVAPVLCVASATAPRRVTVTQSDRSDLQNAKMLALGLNSW